jgi:hypothetical protein
MSRGKPKGIRRKLAKDKPRLVEKLDLSIAGDIVEFSERLIYENIMSMPAINKMNAGHKLYSKKEWICFEMLYMDRAWLRIQMPGSSLKPRQRNC